MPRRAADGRVPDPDALYESAAPLAGYFTLAQAKDAGFSPQLLQFYLREQRIDRAGRGIFRLRRFPVTFDHEDLVPVWLWSEQQGVFSHQSALELHELSDALPAKPHLTLPSVWRVRRVRPPMSTVLHFADLDPISRTWIGPIPVTTPLRTLEDASEDVLDDEWTRQARNTGTRRGLFSAADADRAIERGRARRTP